MVGTGANTFRHTRVRLRRRSVVVTTLLGMAAAALAVVTMMVGDTALSAGEVLGSVLGFADDAAVDFVVWELRLPGAATALFVGLALGVAGLIVQTLLANPLASPDLIGISSGAGLFAVTAIVLLQVGALAVAGAAVAGAVVAAVLIYVLAWRGGLTGYRFILVGIGITQLMTALIGWVLAKAEIGDARQAMTWLVGSVGQAGSVQLRLLAGAVAVLLPVALLSARALRVLQLGDDGARGLGIRVETARSAMIGVSVLLVAFSVAAAGPLAFVALTAGPIAVRLLRGSGTGVLAAAFVGAIIVLAADLVAAHGLPVSLPTGVVTGAVGAPYLIWLLTTVNREGRGG